MEPAETYEARLANGEVEVAETHWGARHIVARRVAFDDDPLNPRNVLPAEIWRRSPKLFGGRAYVETISTIADLTTTG